MVNTDVRFKTADSVTTVKMKLKQTSVCPDTDIEDFQKDLATKIESDTDWYLINFYFNPPKVVKK